VITCRDSELLLSAYCGQKRAPAIFPSENSASCPRKRTERRRNGRENSPLVVVCATITSEAAATPGRTGEADTANLTSRGQPAVEVPRQRSRQDAATPPAADARPGRTAEAGAGDLTSRRETTAADAAKQPSPQSTVTSPADAAMERALNNICRGCTPTVPTSKVPRYDVARTCGAKGSSGSNACEHDENTAKTQVTGQWRRFSVAARSNCQQAVTTGGHPSYVELLSCLQTTKKRS
jgi:hypothetical protein